MGSGSGGPGAVLTVGPRGLRCQWPETTRLDQYGGFSELTCGSPAAPCSLPSPPLPGQPHRGPRGPAGCTEAASHQTACHDPQSHAPDLPRSSPGRKQGEAGPPVSQGESSRPPPAESGLSVTVAATTPGIACAARVVCPAGLYGSVSQGRTPRTRRAVACPESQPGFNPASGNLCFQPSQANGRDSSPERRSDNPRPAAHGC